MKLYAGLNTFKITLLMNSTQLFLLKRLQIYNAFSSSTNYLWKIFKVFYNLLILNIKEI